MYEQFIVLKSPDAMASGDCGHKTTRSVEFRKTFSRERGARFICLQALAGVQYDERIE